MGSLVTYPYKVIALSNKKISSLEILFLEILVVKLTKFGPKFLLIFFSFYFLLVSTPETKVRV